MITNPIQIRRRTSLPVMATLLSLFLGPLAEEAARSLRPISRNHVSMWRWVQRLGLISGPSALT